MHFQIAKKSLSFSVPEYESMLPKYFKVYKSLLPSILGLRVTVKKLKQFIDL